MAYKHGRFGVSGSDGSARPREGPGSLAVVFLACLVVAEQSRAFIEIVTDGMVRWEGLLSRVARPLDSQRGHDADR